MCKLLALQHDISITWVEFAIGPFRSKSNWDVNDLELSIYTFFQSGNGHWMDVGAPEAPEKEKVVI